MDCKATAKLIREAKTFAEVEKSVKENVFSPSQKELLRTSYQISAQQPNLAKQFQETVIKEMEEKSVKEASNEVGGDNRADPLPTLGKKTTDGEKPNTGIESPENQMKEDIFPGLHPDIANSFQNSMNSAPPMNLPQQIKQMQYTARKMIEPVIREVQELRAENKQLREGIVALDGKIQETARGSMKLDVKPRTLRETVDVEESHIKHMPLEDMRFRIAQVNKMMNESADNKTIYG